RGPGGTPRPRPDADPPAGQSRHPRLHPRAAHADAGADRIDVAVVGGDRDLGAPARLARCALHLDDALVDLRHLLPEELDQEPRVRPREDDLWPLAGQLDLQDEGANAVPLTVALARDLLLLRQDGVGAPEVHDDVLLLEALHDAGEELTLPALELVVDDVALGIAHALHDILLRGLRGDAAELLGRQLGEQLVTDLGLGVDLRASHLEGHLVLGVLDLVDHGLDLE